ncbi:hypothetical protein [Sedimentibacter sp. zth1]|nr:hypothetical protein [Sedimentibacter sp. zth1]
MGGGWCGKNGLMISVSAYCREEALHISNELMKYWLPEKYLLR